MAHSIEHSKDVIAQLVRHFATNLSQYRAPGYKEANARQEFIDPLFAALGWDVSNVQHAAPDYREVVVEPSLDVEGHQKAPDYAFRIGRESKFYVEAKKPGVDLKADPGPAYQLRRYAWTARLPLSILTDFEEFAVYDCRRRPSDRDKPAVARTDFYTYQEYPDCWPKIWEVFSKEAVLGGAFDKAAGGATRRGASEVDAEFLKEIEGWRDVLARNFALRNPRLTVDELNEAVQKTIDRIVFLRMAEDRGMEEYGRLQRLAEADGTYTGLVRIARLADDKYNSGLFDFSRDKLTAHLSLDDKVLSAILESLYFPQSPYAFRVLPPEILGSVYERFLGKVIRLTAGHQAKVEEKPEVRKAGGVYYTPAYIVDYIVEQSVTKQIARKSPTQLRGYRVLDMACGSGSFLVGAYRALLDHYLRWYSENMPERHTKAVYAVEVAGYSPGPAITPSAEGSPRAYRLTTAEKKRILTEHIFGVDIDHQAVEVTKLSLLLQVLEGETDETLGKQMRLLHDRALPDLDHNIHCGNSLIGPDYFSGRLLPEAEELARVNAFDWKAAFPEAMAASGFDAVIGNPPYGADLTRLDASFLATAFESSGKTIDSYALFMEQGIRLCRPNGATSMIVPTGWYSGAQFTNLRRLIATSLDPFVFVNLPYDIFAAWIDTTIYAGIKRAQRTSWPRTNTASVAIKTFPKRHKILSGEEFLDGLSQVEFSSWFESGDDTFLTYADTLAWSLIQRVDQLGVPLGKLCDVQRGVTPFNLTTGRTHSSSRAAFTGTVRRYSIDPGPKMYIRFDETLAEPKPERYFLGERLLLRELISRQFQLQAVLVDDSFVTNKSMQSVLARAEVPSLRYVLGLVNSKLLSWLFLKRSNVGQRDDFPKIVLKESRALPIRPISFADSADKARHDKMVTLVDRMLELHKRKQATGSDHERQLVQRQIDSTDGQIDALVYELYRLSDEEIIIVEATGS